MTRKLTFPAPKRLWYKTPVGWASRKWSVVDVLEYLAAGGWFLKGKHDFESGKAARAAGVVHE